jgi:capsular polysaccharide transport system permease protein
MTELPKEALAPASDEPQPGLRAVDPPDKGDAAPAPAPKPPVAISAARRRARAAAKAQRSPAPALPEDEEALPAGPLPDPGPLPEVRPAAVRLRHWLLAASFLLLVLLPLAGSIAYLYGRAADQYHSEVAFSVRSEEVAAAAAGLIGAITQIGGGPSDADILYEYIRSQTIVEEIDAELDLRTIYNRAADDPVFTLGDNRSIEALHGHWRRMVEVAYDSATGIIHVRANAFAAADAQAIAAAILERSSLLVNQLSEQAREDAVRFAREELAEAEDNLRIVRQRLADFRLTHNIVDPTADVAGQMGLLSALQAELAQALVDRDVILSYAAEDDQRVIQANRRIEAITARIEDERGSLELTGVAGSLPEVVGRYEELLVDLEFANTAYTQALAGLAAARAEARRQSRYLAPHIQPTQAESALYPRRTLLAGLAGLFLLLGWGILMLVYYNVRDNR